MKRGTPQSRKASAVGLHRVTAAGGCNALSPRYVGPLLGNGELSCFLDENGAMHDFAAFQGWPSPRLYWAGRRRGGQERPLAPFGFFTLQPNWEWMESTAWSQELAVRRGAVVTEHRRGAALDRTETVLLLDRNVIAVHRHVERLRGSPRLRFTFRLCPPNSTELPPATMLTGRGQDAAGAWLDYRLDGVVTYCGRIALWADRPGTVSCQGNALSIEVPLAAAADDVTFYLAFADDLGDDTLCRQSGWAGRHADHPLLAPIIHDLYQRPVTRGEPLRQVSEWRAWTERTGWDGVCAHQAAAWAEYWGTGWVSLPDAPAAQTLWETGMYAIRTQLTRWSVPVAIHGDYFNGQYFWDAMASVRALLRAGHWPRVTRLLEHSLSVVPLGMQTLDGTGVRDCAPSFEGGYFYMWPAGCSVYEVHASDCPARLAWSWYRYAGADRGTLARYYPLFWGPAEFFRRWMVYTGPDGKLFTGACVDANESVPAVVNGVATVAAAVTSTRLAAQVAELLERDADLAAKWRSIAGGLSAEPAVNKRGLLASHRDDDGVAFTAFSVVADPPFKLGLLPAADRRVRRTVDAWLTECKTAENWAVAAAGDAATAKASQDVANPDPVAWTWPAAEAVRVLALMGEGEKAAAVVAELARCSQNFASLYECKVMTDGYVSLPWFVTSSAELAASIASMLLQDDGERITVLPAVPARWRRCAFRLAALNRTTVEVRIAGGRLREFRLVGPPGSRCVRVPARFRPAELLGRPTATGRDWAEFVIEPEPTTAHAQGGQPG
jgi:hypothetical protein